MRYLNWIVLIGAIFLSGCSIFGKKTGNEPMELVKFSETVKVKKVWSHNVGAGQGSGLTRLTPSISGDVIYTVDHKGLVVALNRTNGKKHWDKKLRVAISAGISSGEGMLLVATANGEVIALSQDDGSELWRKRLNGEILAAPATNGEVVGVQTMNGRVYALNAKDGAELWFYENPPPVLTLRGTPAPIVTSNAIYAGFSNGRLMAFNPDNGSILWEQRLAVPQGRSELDRMVDIRANPILRDGTLFAASYQGKVSALARGTGSSIWTQDASTSENLALSGNHLFLATAGGKLASYDATTGELRWENEQLLRRVLNSPQAVDGYVAVSDYQGFVHFVDQNTGEFVARRKVDKKGIFAQMQTDGDVLYVFGNRGKLTAFTVSAD